MEGVTSKVVVLARQVGFQIDFPPNIFHGFLGCAYQSSLENYPLEQPILQKRTCIMTKQIDYSLHCKIISVGISGTGGP